MSILDRLSSASSRKDEALNIELAQEIYESHDTEAVKTLVGALGHADKRIQNDCIKVLYEIGERDPALISVYSENFGALLSNSSDRLVWGAMTALDCIAKVDPDSVSTMLDLVMAAAEGESVIARDHAVGILVKLAALPAHSSRSVRRLLDQLVTAPPGQFPMYCEMAVPVFSRRKTREFVDLLEARMVDFKKESQKKRVAKVLKKLGPPG